MDFACGMAAQTCNGILRSHAASVIGYAHEGDPAALYLGGDTARTRIYRVFGKLLYHRGRSLHNLACGDQVRHAHIENIDYSHSFILSSGYHFFEFVYKIQRFERSQRIDIRF